MFFALCLKVFRKFSIVFFFQKQKKGSVHKEIIPFNVADQCYYVRKVPLSCQTYLLIPKTFSIHREMVTSKYSGMKINEESLISLENEAFTSKYSCMKIREE